MKGRYTLIAESVGRKVPFGFHFAAIRRKRQAPYASGIRGDPYMARAVGCNSSVGILGVAFPSNRDNIGLRAPHADASLIECHKQAPLRIMAIGTHIAQAVGVVGRFERRSLVEPAAGVVEYLQHAFRADQEACIPAWRDHQNAVVTHKIRAGG